VNDAGCSARSWARPSPCFTSQLESECRRLWSRISGR